MTRSVSDLNSDSSLLYEKKLGLNLFVLWMQKLYYLPISNCISCLSQPVIDARASLGHFHG